MIALAALMTGLAVGLWLSARHGRAGRLDTFARYGRHRPMALGIALAIAAMVASVRNGATVTEAFEEQAGRRFATPRISARRAGQALSRRADDHDDEAHIRDAARQLEAACTLSDELGCEASRCLEAVGVAYRRTRLLDDRRREMMAGPESTVRLLTGLPVLTVIMGEAMGAHPLAWMTSSVFGWICLGLGLGFYAAGMIWTRRLLAAMAAASMGKLR
ncbi:type II secretion system F family protein [Bifidobacterium vespertilionis]|uniref:type II secretion system F family protein n=1 Tax=Bifidobacterium vespertilionis TaxID=2562524 RepID=UPI001BDC4D27|nr:pilus assembly protein [Bifidobacterium vespertilionis]MBT1179342.1 pilus assembly protein [Bifidobacterium vespertilionis]